MKRSVITSSVMYKAHKMTRIMVKKDSGIHYRTQLGLNIRYIMAQDKEAYQKRIDTIKALKWIKQYINHDNSIHSEEMTNIINKMNYDLMIRHFYWGKSYNAWSLAGSLVKNHRKNIQKWA
jgi:hypothetical protein